MKKRFTDCDRFDDPWFRKLPLSYKALWEFITAKCDNAGVWKVDFELASFMIGERVYLQEALEFFNSGKNRVETFKEGYWLICGFVDFQFGGMDGENNFHKQIRSLYQSHGLKPFQGQVRGCLAPLEKEKDKDKEKEESFGKSENLLGKNPGVKTNELAEREKWFLEIWQKYPVKDGKKHAKRHFLASVKTAEDYARISAALEAYLGSKRVQEGFIKNASTWFNGWEDWVNYQEPRKQETDKEKADRIIASMRAEKYAKSV